MGEVAPFALIFWALVIRCCPGRKHLVTGATLLGWMIAGVGVFPPWSLPAGMLMWKFIDVALTRIRKKPPPFFLTLPFTMILVRLPLLFWYHFTFYEYFIAGMEVALAFLLPPLLQPFFYELDEMTGRGKPSPEAVVGALLLLALVLLGMNEIVLGKDLKLINVISPLFILVGAYLWGPLWGITSGVLVGLCLSIGDPLYFSYTGALGIAGMVAGLLQQKRRLWAALAYFSILRFLSYFGVDGGFAFTSLPEELMVVTVFLLVPLSVWEKLKSLEMYWPFKLEGEEKLRNTMAARIKELAAVFQELAVTFQPLNQAETVRSKRDLSPVIDYFSRKVCRACEQFNRCWEDDLSNQCRRVLAMLSALEEGGAFTEKMIPVRLRRYCPRQQEIVRAVVNMKEIYRLNCYWQDKIREGRLLVSQQLNGISFVMHDLAQELKLQVEEEGEKGREIRNICFSVEIGVAQVARNGQSVSGDSYAVLPLKDARQAILLSDGMGSGKEARRASRSTVKLMEHLLGAGFRREIAISTINTLLRLRFPAENFATLDLALLDLQSGEIDLYKLGAPPSFLKSGDMIRIVGSGSLPVGILEDIIPEEKQIRAFDGGILVMVTDGILGNSANQKESWLVGTLKKIRHDHPQIIADRLIEEACQRCRGEVEDDLTVLVGCVKKII